MESINYIDVFNCIIDSVLQSPLYNSTLAYKTTQKTQGYVSGVK